MAYPRTDANPTLYMEALTVFDKRSQKENKAQVRDVERTICYTLA